MSDSTPTSNVETPEPAPSVGAGSPRTGLLIAAGAIIFVLLILLAISLTRTSDASTPTETSAPTESATATETPTPTPTPTEEPTASPTPTESATAAPPVPTPTESATAAPLPIFVPAFISFVAPRVTTCLAESADAEQHVPLIAVSWNTTDAQEAWFAAGAGDAADEHSMEIPIQGDEGDFSEPQYFPCDLLSSKYTITLVSADGSHVSKTWTVLNTGDKFAPEAK